jgi:mRNA interferase HigB
MRIISVKTLKDFWEQNDFRDAEEPLKAWAYEAMHAEWRKSDDVVQHYRTADPIPGNRVVFNIKGNKYRLIVKIHYNTGIMYIRFIGTHAEYDRIDAENI